MPVICIPTSLSGGEYSATAGGTDDDTGQKHSFSGALLAPALVILDPELTTTTPEKVWLSTGIKAVDHCVEALCSLKSNDIADGDARRGLAKLIPGLIKSKQDPKNLEARLECQLGARDAMSAATRGVPLGASRMYNSDYLLSPSCPSPMLSPCLPMRNLVDLLSIHRPLK